MTLTGPLLARHLRIALASVSLLGFAAPVTAQPATPAQTQTSTLSIPAGSLERALLALGRQTDLRLVYRSEITAGKTTKGASGPLTPSAALATLLSGTGLSFRMTGNTATLEASASTPAEGAGPAGDTVLETIVLRDSAGNSADQPYETAGSTSYISAEQIQRFRGSSAGDLFKNTPGVISASNHSSGSINVNIRGLQGQNRVRVTIDGAQQSATTWRGYGGVDDRTYIDPDLIGGVAIAKGPTGGAEGAGVNGGVVSIRSLAAKDIVEEGKQYGGRIRIGTQDNTTSDFTTNSYNQQTDSAEFFDLTNGNGSFAIATVQDNFDLVIAGARRYRGNFFAGKYGNTHYFFSGRDQQLSLTKPGEEVFNSSNESTSFLAKGTFRFDEDHSLELGYIRYESEFGQIMTSLLTSGDNTFRQAALSDVTTDTFTSRYRYNPSDLIDLKVNAYLSIVDQNSMSTGFGLYFPQFNIIPADDPRYAMTHTWGGDISNTSKFETEFGDVKISYGASYLLEDIDSRRYFSRGHTYETGVPMDPSIGSRSIASVFGQGTWQATDWLTLNAGLRYDRYRLEDDGLVSRTGVREKDGGRLNPSVSAIISPIDGLQLYALYAEGVRPPTMRETMGNDGNVIQNPYLKAEVSKNWEVGVNYSMDGLLLDDDALRLKLSYFNNNYTDYISRVPSNAGAGQPVFAFDNLHSSRFAGFEISGSYDAGMFFTQASLTKYTDYQFCRTLSTCSNTTVDMDYAANHMPPEIMASLTLGMRLFEDKLSFGTRFTHGGDRLSPVTQGARAYTGMWLAYTTVDAFATYKITDNLTFDLQAENLTDRYYVDALDGFTPAPGRTIRASLTAKF